jgi:alpha-beta hydrolase superfamily lysophospholipase
MRILKHLGLFLAYAVLGLVVALAGAYVVYLRHLPAPQLCHAVKLDAEFRASDLSSVKTIEDYRRLEDRLFSQLRERVYDRVAPEDRRKLSRYSPGSFADPFRMDPDWNRTTVMTAVNPRGGVLLLHGLTDSPYSMRGLAERFHRGGFTSVVLRLPGHGTAPSGLRSFRWEDLAAATRLAARDLRIRLGQGPPLYLVGYSTGAALAVEYALSQVGGEDLPPPAGLVLLSPAIGVSPAAVFAAWQGRISGVPGLEKAAWTAVMPEYDPYKYASFTVNAAEQVYRLTQEIRARLSRLDVPGGVRGLPHILAFQSAADDTVSTAAVIDALFRRLASDGHELVLFDINRNAQAEPFFRPGVLEVRYGLLSGPPLPFDLTVLTNAGPGTQEVIAVHRHANANDMLRSPTGLRWPREVFSLSHVALPFPPDDPVYGAERPAVQHLIYLGSMGIHGERGLLSIPVGDLIRLRHNPFFAYIETRVTALVGLAEDR